MNKITIPTAQLIPLASWLNELTLAGRDSRERSRFIKSLETEIKDLELLRVEVVEKYAEKNEDGSPKIEEKEGSSQYSITNMKGFQEEMNAIFEGDFIIDVLESNKATISTIARLILDTDYKFGPKEGDSMNEKIAKVRQSNDYTLWCDIFEPFRDLQD